MFIGRRIKNPMNNIVCRRSRCNASCAVIALVVSLAAVCVIQSNFPLVRIQLWDQYCTPKLSTTPRPTSTPSPTPPSPRPVDSCNRHPLSPQDAHEEQLILNLTSWPETPPLSASFSVLDTSDPAHSRFTILPGPGGREWRVGDQLEVLIQLNDFQGRPKRSGGDVLLTSLHSPTLDAGVAGRVVDHLNGTYSAVFPLLWEGDAQAQVILVHPSEAVTLLRQLTIDHPDRIYFKSLFRSGSVSESTICNVCLPPTTLELCNFTDPRSGEMWFCYKPKRLSCDTRVQHIKGGFIKNTNAKHEALIKSKVNLKMYVQSSGAAGVKVVPNKKGQSELKSRHLVSPPAGYYYQGLWRALDGTTVRHFSTPSNITQCLKGKVVHLYGDSTIRQWFEYFTKAAPDLKEFNLHNNQQSGPRMAIDHANNILVTYRCHGPPIRFASVPTHTFNYITNELDGLVGGGDTVVVIGVWSHFSTFPIQVYIQRMRSIRGAVVRLLQRAPATRVVIRTANVKALFSVYETVTNSDWYSMQRDIALRAIFKGVNVRLVDAWDMTLAHRLPHNLHPQPPIIQNMIDVVLSYVCP